MDGELIKLITIIAIPTVTIVASNIALFLHISNKIDKVSERITKLEVEFEKLNSKFDLLEERYNGIKMQTENTDKRIEKVEYELKESRTENKNLIEKILDILPKSAL